MSLDEVAKWDGQGPHPYEGLEEPSPLSPEQTQAKPGMAVRGPFKRKSARVLIIRTLVRRNDELERRVAKLEGILQEATPGIRYLASVAGVHEAEWNAWEAKAREALYESEAS